MKEYTALINPRDFLVAKKDVDVAIISETACGTGVRMMVPGGSCAILYKRGKKWGNEYAEAAVIYGDFDTTERVRDGEDPVVSILMSQARSVYLDSKLPDWKDFQTFELAELASD